MIPYLIVAGAALLVGMFIGAAVRDVFLSAWGGWLLFWDEMSYAGRRIAETVGALAFLAVVFWLIIHFW